MPCGTWKMTGVPEAEVERCKYGFEIDDAKSITAEKQDDGTYTVIAVFEDCPAGEPNETERAFPGS